MPDLKWQSQGGVLLDGTGDLALCDSTLESFQDMVRSRLKAALNGWKLYPIGADLESQIGEMAPAEREPAVQRLVRNALSRDFLPAGAFTVETLVSGSSMTVFVYLDDTLIATTQVNLAS